MSVPAAPLSLKPDLQEAAERWEAYLGGELIDRPLVCVTAPIPGRPTAPGAGYRERVFGDLDEILDNALINAAATWYGGEAMPTVMMSLGCDEAAVFCGAELRWSEDSAGTNWSVPFVEDWDRDLPLALDEDHPLWRRLVEFYRRASARLGGHMLLSSFDTHTNMDLLAAVRGPERLCLDLVDRPETIDHAMVDARAIFPRMWRALAEAGRMDQHGYCNGIYSMSGATILQCDFSCMMSPAMFRRWVLPALEEEAAVAGHTFYHWDGPGALMHADDLFDAPFIHTLGYVPTVTFSRGLSHFDSLDLLVEWQRAGKAVQAVGTPDGIKQMHGRLDPARVMYCTSCACRDEAEELLDWFVANT